MERLIRNERHNPEQSLQNQREVLSRLLAVSPSFKVLKPYHPRDVMAGDPASKSAVKVAWEELDEGLQQRIIAGGVFRVSELLSVSIPGQVTFMLTGAPEAALPVELEVNGVSYRDLIYFTRAGNVITWLDVEFQLDTPDRVEVFYYM